MGSFTRDFAGMVETGVATQWRGRAFDSKRKALRCKAFQMAPDVGHALRLAHPALAQDDGSRLNIATEVENSHPIVGWLFSTSPDVGLEPTTR
jgi:hypothetical protein